MKYADKVLKTLELALRELPKIELRVPVVPTLHDKNTILEIIKEIDDIVKCNREKYEGVKVVLQQFVPSETVLSEKFRKIQRTPLAVLHQIAREAIRKFRLNEIYVRSIERGVEIIQD